MSTTFCALILLAAGASEAPAPNSPAEFRQAVSEALRGEALAAPGADREAAVRRVVELSKLVRDSSVLSRPTAADLQQRLQTRLRRVRDELKQEAANQPRRPDDVNLPDRQGERLAQFFPPGQGQGQAGAGPQAKPEGAELIEVIEETIEPASWQRFGGPGTIVYYKSHRVLVIRQRQDIHGNLAQLIGGVLRGN